MAEQIEKNNSTTPIQSVGGMTITPLRKILEHEFGDSFLKAELSQKEKNFIIHLNKQTVNQKALEKFKTNPNFKDYRVVLTTLEDYKLETGK